MAILWFKSLNLALACFGLNFWQSLICSAHLHYSAFRKTAKNLALQYHCSPFSG